MVFLKIKTRSNVIDKARSKFKNNFVFFSFIDEMKNYQYVDQSSLFLINVIIDTTFRSFYFLRPLSIIDIT